MATITDADRAAIMRISSAVRKGASFLDDLKSLNNALDKSQTFAPRRQYLKNLQNEIASRLNTLEEIEISMKHLR